MEISRGEWMLRTRDAHGLYKKPRFTPPANPSSIMERRGTTSSAETDLVSSKS
ncbi:MAG TPA: hypothetical protein VM166_14130 [Gemmatimonadaceae bacterium]|nr:hypothetical protein [Gemmatimonadaceae bacterium]